MFLQLLVSKLVVKPGTRLAPPKHGKFSLMNLLQDGSVLFLVLYLTVSLLSQLCHIPAAGCSICLALPCPESYLDTAPGPACCSSHRGRKSEGRGQSRRSLERDLGKAWVADARTRSRGRLQIYLRAGGGHHEQPNNHLGCQEVLLHLAQPQHPQCTKLPCLSPPISPSCRIPGTEQFKARSMAFRSLWTATWCRCEK